MVPVLSGRHSSVSRDRQTARALPGMIAPLIGSAEVPTIQSRAMPA